MFFLNNWRWCVEHQRRIFHVSTLVKVAASHTKEANILCSFHIGWTLALHSNGITFFESFWLIFCCGVWQRWGVILVSGCTKFCYWWHVSFVGGAAAKIWRRRCPSVLLRGSFPIVRGLCNLCLVNSRSGRTGGSLSWLRLVKVWSGRVFVLEQVGVFERVWLVRHFLERLGLNFLPIVRRFQLHEHSVLHDLVNRGTH